jgi:hypothetical protein
LVAIVQCFAVIRVKANCLVVVLDRSVVLVFVGVSDAAIDKRQGILWLQADCLIVILDGAVILPGSVVGGPPADEVIGITGIQFNIQVQGTITGLPTVTPPNLSELTSASNRTGAATKTVALTPTGKQEPGPSVIIVEVLATAGPTL